MSISYIYRSSYLITFGIGFIILSSLVFISINFSIYNDFPGNQIIKFQIFSILILTIEPIIIGWGVFNIIKGTNQYEIQFSEKNFKSYKNLKSEIDVPIEKIEIVNIIHVSVSSWVGGVKFKKIEIELKEMEKFQLTIKGKKWISKFLKFIELLQQYCNEKQIQFIESNDD